MKLERLGSFHQTRLSFMRVLLRRLARDGWRFSRTVWNVDAQGNGHAVYELSGNGRLYSLIAFANDLDPAKRTDRVIAEEWDATFTLHDGTVGAADIERLSRNVPRQEAGRCTAGEIVLARANKSVRLFELVKAALAGGKQPAQAELDDVGYLMRTTAVYGSGKFGLADYETISDRPEFSGPFAAEMMTVFLIRAYTVDLVEHMARCMAPETAVPLDRALARRLGVGNSTGLGMAPFLVTHAALIDRWMTARETALARVRSIEHASPAEIGKFLDMLARGSRQMAAWSVDDQVQMGRIEELRADLKTLSDHARSVDLAADHGWDSLFRFAERTLGLEAQEFLVTLLIEPYGELVDDLADTMRVDEAQRFKIDGGQPLGTLAQTIDATYGFALRTDFDSAEATARFWYVSEEKLEPRLGERAIDDGASLEQPLAVARDIKALRRMLDDFPPQSSVAAFLLRHPEFRHVVRRAQISADFGYAEIRDNLIDTAMRPIDLLRCKLSFFGATDFDPRSDRWVRITLFRHAPFPDELGLLDADGWTIPPAEAAAAEGEARAAMPAIQATPIIPTPAGDLLSLNELDALVRKAARGSGLPWGIAEEAGKVARKIALAGQPRLETLADTLEAGLAGHLCRTIEIDGAKWRPADSRPLDPLVLGPAIVDHAYMLATADLSVQGRVFQPELLAPFIQQATRDVPGSVQTMSDLADGALGSGLQALTLSKSSIPACRPEPATPRAVDASADLRRRLEALAALTYVRSSDRSRASGAGAGLSDND